MGVGSVVTSHNVLAETDASKRKTETEASAEGNSSSLRVTL